MIVTKGRFILGLYMLLSDDVGNKLPQEAEENEMIRLAYEILAERLKHILESQPKEEK